MVIRSTPRTSRKEAEQLAKRRALRELDARYNAIRDAKPKEPKAKKRALTKEQAEAIRHHYRPDESVMKVIRKGDRQPRTWDEVNSTNGGGRDFGKRT